MAENSKARVTITLGRSGQVVKRAATVSDDYSNLLPTVGNKRSVRDRLGSNSDSWSVPGSHGSSSYKRQRGDSSLTSLVTNDVRVGKDDLRYKLMQKNVFTKAQNDDGRNKIDLREKLSRTAQPSGPSIGSFGSQRQMPELKSSSLLGQIPSRSADYLRHMDSSRNSHSAWTLEHIRRRSPDRLDHLRSADRVLGTSRGLSPPRNVESLQRRPLNRSLDALMHKDVLDTPRSVTSSTSFMTKPVLPSISAKPVVQLPGQYPPASGAMQKNSYPPEEAQTVEGLLHSLGLGKYSILFKAEEVDMTALKQMGESDLKELGIPMGPRKKILLALTPRSRRQP